MNKYFAISAVAVTLATGAIAESADRKLAPESYLFVETADKAELSNGKLVLHGVDDEISVFSDRPYRNAGVITRTHLLNLWDKGEDSFATDPPNVALTGNVDGKSQVVILEISNPGASGDQIAYDYTFIEGSDATTFDNPVMVIDSFWRPAYTGPDGGLP